MTTEELKAAVAKHALWLLGDASGVRADLTGANLTGADLTGANLAGAGLTGADLTRANLTRANLTGANLTGADLTGANLAGAGLSRANLSEADLTWAYLRRANLTGANLSEADLTRADLTGANLTGANLTGANLAGANLTGADLRRANLPARVPVIVSIDSAILAAIRQPGCGLDMSDWHTCSTTHCRAGWAIHLAGDAGRVLEDLLGASAAGALIYAASRPGKPVPDFLASDEAAMADLERCAAEEVASGN